jgi:hypothetical protein
MDARDILVKITQVINPNRFFLCDLSCDEKIEALRQLENTLPGEVPSQACIEPKINDVSIKDGSRMSQSDDFLLQIVGYFPPHSGKWIRAEVDAIKYDSKGDKVALLWAIDYGRPVSTKRFANLKPLPRDVKETPSLIIHGGLSVGFRTIRWNFSELSISHRFCPLLSP